MRFSVGTALCSSHGWNFCHLLRLVIDMREKRLLPRLLMVTAIRAVAGCACVSLTEPAIHAAQAQPSGDLWFGSMNLYRPSGRSGVTQHQKRKSKPEQNAKTSKKPSSLGTAIATIQSVPLPRSRPPAWPEPATFAEAVAGLNFNSADVTDQPTACDARLAGLAVAELMPRLIGPETCGVADMVELEAVLMPGNSRITVNPPALLNCGMAETVARWLHNEAAPRVAKLGSALTAIENYDSYECRTRNRIPGAKISEHAHGDALDVRAFHLTDGRRLELTDVRVDKSLREGLRESACHSFTTVLGPGDPNHNSHIHLDVIQRTRGYRICQWDVREQSPTTQIANAHVRLATTSLPAQERPRDNQTVTVGPWAIATNYKATKFESCAMSRSEGELGITFLRTQDALLLILDSPKWKLDRGKAYSVRLSAGARSVNTKALAETKNVTIALTDTSLKSKLRSVSSLEVRGEGDTLRVPLDGSATAFERLEGCFNKHDVSEINPFVRRKASETNPFVAPSRKH